MIRMFSSVNHSINSLSIASHTVLRQKEGLCVDLSTENTFDRSSCH